MVENGIPGEFPKSPEDIQANLIKGFGSVEDGIEKMAANAKLITKEVPSWAPDRKQMPVIEPEQVPKAAAAMTKGVIDHTSPHTESRRNLGSMNESETAILDGFRIALTKGLKGEALPVVKATIKGGVEMHATYNRGWGSVTARAVNGKMVISVMTSEGKETVTYPLEMSVNKMVDRLMDDTNLLNGRTGSMSDDRYS